MNAQWHSLVHLAGIHWDLEGGKSRSLLDTLPDVSDVEDVAADEMLLSTGAVDAVEDLEVLDAQISEQLVKIEAVLPAEQRPPNVQRPPARKRVRHKADGHEPRSRADICKAAADVRWQKRREGKANEDPIPAHHSDSGDMGLAIVDPDQSHDDNKRLAILRSSLKYDGDTTKEKTMYESSKHLISAAGLSKQLGVDAKTVKERLRLMASIVCFGARHRLWSTLKHLVETWKEQAVDFEAVLHVVKQRYDEFMIKVRLNDLPDGLPSRWVKEGSETIMAKLMQIATSHTFLFRVNGRHLVVEGTLPTMLKPIESTHAKCIKYACVDQSGGQPAWVDYLFSDLVRLTVHDGHGSNAAADYSIRTDNVKRVLAMFKCSIHFGHKICENQWQGFPG